MSITDSAYYRGWLYCSLNWKAEKKRRETNSTISGTIINCCPRKLLTFLHHKGSEEEKSGVSIDDSEEKEEDPEFIFEYGFDPLQILGTFNHITTPTIQ